MSKGPHRAHNVYSPYLPSKSKIQHYERAMIALDLSSQDGFY
jgi:hypothetical protein